MREFVTRDDYYLNLLDWGSTNVLAIALGHTVYLWDAADGNTSELVTVDDDAGPVTSVKWAPDGRHISVGLNSSDVQLWDSTSNKLLRTLRGCHQSRVGSMDWNSHILTTGGMDGQIVNNDVRIRSHIVETYSGHHQEVCGLKWSASGQQLASGGNDNLLHIWDRSAASVNSPTQWLHRLEDHTAAVKALNLDPKPNPNLSRVAHVKQEPVKSFNENQVKNYTKKPDIVPDKPRKRKHRKKQATASAPEVTVRKCEKWTTEEEVVLARAWVNEPEEPKIDHWKRVREKFHNTMGRGEYRNPDMISSKWRETRLKVEKFEGIYKKNFDNRESGTSDLNIFQDSCDEYKAEMGSAFIHNKVWEVVRTCTKWANLSLIGQSSKRTKTSPHDECTCLASSDDHCRNDFNDKDDELETQEEPIHPPGSNNKGKRAASSNEPDYKQSLDNILSKMSTFLELMREKQEYSDFKILAANIDHLTGQDRELAEKLKQKVRDKYKM
ncbi:uncharacterized protein LOC143532242 [Bidens hawaiensis]|uniref:uncharacterized protein LOC143532242 n=1 Tax=Bidens hawaiensis TaxID=980011 RepID=UPI00404AA541